MRTVKCPTCKKPTAYEESNPHRPFCGERCQTQDTANWASETYRVPAAFDESDDITDLED